MIHTKGWIPQQLTLATDGNFKHLGIIWDMDLSNETQREIIEKYLRESTAYVIARKASVESKLLAIQKSIVPKILYVLKYMPWTLQQYETLQRIIDSAIKRITKNGRHFGLIILRRRDWHRRYHHNSATRQNGAHDASNATTTGATADQ